MQKSNPTQTVNQNVSQVQIKDSRTITYVRGKEFCELFIDFLYVPYICYSVAKHSSKLLQKCDNLVASSCSN